MIFIFLLVNTVLCAQKSYYVDIAIDRIYVNGDSLKFPRGKRIQVETSGKTDTVSLGKCGGEEIGMCVVIRKIKDGDHLRTQIGYSFFKKNNAKWELIHDFGFVDRYALKTYSAKAKSSAPKEEYNCEYGVPVQFAAYFRMEVYSKN
ncbi:MAG: hypothetical protein HY064_09510 [Bacteroidetes bacterium]|nr:hypothetical protein [Bacteroidota bacterium]